MPGLFQLIRHSPLFVIRLTRLSSFNRAWPICGIAALVFVAATDTIFAQETYRLQYQFKPGQFARYSVTTRMNIKVQLAEAVQKTSNETIADKVFRVVTVDEQGVATLEPMVQRVQMKASDDNGNISQYDSNSPGDPPVQYLSVKQSTGRPLVRLSVRPTGELVSVVPLATDLPQVAKAAAENDPMLNFLVRLPAEPVAIGGSWKDQYEVEVNVEDKLKQKVAIRRQYTLDRVTNGIAVISMKSSVLTPITDPKIEGQLLQRTPAGTIEFDLAQGMVLKHSAKIDKQVVGAFGPRTVIHGVSEILEVLVPDLAAAQRLPSGAADQAAPILPASSVAP